MKQKLCILAISCIFIMSSLAVAGVYIPQDVPQPYAGRTTIAAPELLEGPNVSTVKTIQDGEVSQVTEKLIKQGVIPAAVDKELKHEEGVPTN